MLLIHLLGRTNIYILAHVYLSFIEVNFEFTKREGKRVKFTPGRVFVHFHLRTITDRKNT